MSSFSASIRTCAWRCFSWASLIRFDREQYTWKSDSSQLLSRQQLRWGSNLFHIGILGIFFGHLVGLLKPVDVWHAVGVSAPAKQMLAIVAGGIFGVICFVGLALLIHRRLTVDRIRATTKPMDLIVLGLILVQLALGLVSLSVSWAHRDGGEMVRLMTWAQHIVTFRGDAASSARSSSDQPMVSGSAHIVMGAPRGMAPSGSLKAIFEWSSQKMGSSSPSSRPARPRYGPAARTVRPVPIVCVPPVARTSTPRTRPPGASMRSTRPSTRRTP